MVHLLLGFRQQVEDTRGRLHHEQVMILELALVQLLQLAGHADLALLQVDGAYGFLGAFVAVVLQHVGVATHAALAQDKPTLSP